MSATLIVRADASPQMGTGHVLRSLALAAAWQAAGGRAVFVTYCPAPSLCQKITAAGIQLVTLDRLQYQPEPVISTLREVIEAVGGDTSARPWIALDGYHFPAVCQKAIRRMGCRLLVIDDMAQHPLYHADLLLNQNLGAEQYTYRCDSKARLLLGTQHVLLRPEFQTWQAWQREVPPVAKRLLVTLGGADPQNTTSLVIEALKTVNVSGLKARVVVGAANAHAAEIQRRAAGLGDWIELLASVPDMPAQMAWADMAVAAAGLTCWELAYMQLPALLLVIADNQEQLAAQASEAGMARSMGWARRQTPQTIAAAVAGLCMDRSTRLLQSRVGRRLVDGTGAQRVVAAMQAFSGAAGDNRPGSSVAEGSSVIRLRRAG